MTIGKLKRSLYYWKTTSVPLSPFIPPGGLAVAVHGCCSKGLGFDSGRGVRILTEFRGPCIVQIHCMSKNVGNLMLSRVFRYDVYHTLSSCGTLYPKNHPFLFAYSPQWSSGYVLDRRPVGRGIESGEVEFIRSFPLWSSITWAAVERYTPWTIFFFVSHACRSGLVVAVLDFWFAGRGVESYQWQCHFWWRRECLMPGYLGSR